MDPKKFEVYYREEVRQILDKLQSAMLVSSQLEAALAEIGEAVQVLSRNVEQYLVEKDSGPS
jgi:predicted metal-binding protein